MQIALLTPPAEPLLPMEEVYQHLRLDADLGSPAGRPDDAWLTTAIAAVTSYLDGWSGILGRALVTQVYRATACRPDPYSRFELPMPVASVDAVEVLADDAYSAVPDAQWTWRDMGATAIARPRSGLNWPAHDADEAAFRITFTAGFGAAADVPAAIKQAALLLLGSLYENREADITGTMITALPHGADMLLAPFRVRPNG